MPSDETPQGRDKRGIAVEIGSSCESVSALEELIRLKQLIEDSDAKLISILPPELVRVSSPGNSLDFES